MPLAIGASASSSSRISAPVGRECHCESILFISALDGTVGPATLLTLSLQFGVLLLKLAQLHHLTAQPHQLAPVRLRGFNSGIRLLGQRRIASPQRCHLIELVAKVSVFPRQSRYLLLQQEKRGNAQQHNHQRPGFQSCAQLLQECSSRSRNAASKLFTELPVFM